MRKSRWSFLEEIREEKRNMEKRIKEYDRRLEELKPFHLEYWRIEKRKQKLERDLKKHSL